MSECLVGFRHLMSILAALDRGTETVGGIEDFVGQALGHGLLATSAGEVRQPAQGQGVGTSRLHLDRNLVGGATDTAGANLEGRADVVESALQNGSCSVFSLTISRAE